MKKIMLVFGTRPEAIKMCPVVMELKKRADFKTVVVVTGQHREMLDQVLHAFDVKPDYDLHIMKDGQDLFYITNEVLSRMKRVIEIEMPQVVLVHGDTTTTFAASLSAFYFHIPVGHVEAGLRTRNIYSPWPEEYNRQAVSIISSYNFAPTKRAAQNLIDESRQEDYIWVTGNTAIDALKTTIRTDYTHPELTWALSEDSRCECKPRMILITAHRRENLGEPMKRMFRAIRRVVKENHNVRVIYPIHMNPIVRDTANEVFEGTLDQIHLIEPLDVIDFHNIMSRAYIILTDSGGVQEEAPSLGVPVLVMRDTTERPEGINSGTCKLVGTREEEIYREFTLLLNDRSAYYKMSQAVNPYGDGRASERIADILEYGYPLSEFGT